VKRPVVDFVAASIEKEVNKKIYPRYKIARQFY
jgi:hypothetical protein